MSHFTTAITFTALMAASGATSTTFASDHQPIPDPSESVFVMGGMFHNEWIWDTASFWRDHYEDNGFLGVGYQKFMPSNDFGFSLGGEIGVGLRLGHESSAEIWGGPVLRHTGLKIGGFTVAPSVTAGFSVVTNTIGVETERANAIGRDVPVLFYLGPEISIAHDALPNFETFGRIQHRSGGFGVIAEIDGSNAAVAGVRFKF